MPYPRIIDLHRLLLAVSRALDLSSPGLVPHHRTVALLSLTIAQELGLDDAAKSDLLCSAIIHDIGVSTSRERTQMLLSEHQLSHHAVVGGARLRTAPVLAPYAETIQHHHDRWDGRTPNGRAGEAIPLASRIIHIADRIAVRIRQDVPVILQGHDLVREVEAGAGTTFDPALVRCVSRLVSRERVLLDVTSDFMLTLLDELTPARGIEIDSTGLLGVAGVMADVIDGKSPFTRKHSQNVAGVAVRLARHLGFSQRELTMMQIAGLLHDLGKLAIPDAVLDKPEGLSTDERALMRQHPYFTYHVIRMVSGLETVSEWAGYHHERLDGSGYPFRLPGDQIPLGARIMAVADVLSALAEDRPYRRPLGERAVLDQLEAMAREGWIDRTVVALAFDCRSEILDLVAA
jgi:HD-GYP domain-containing protein (c-di-GMP phosphodiesterase class II)